MRIEYWTLEDNADVCHRPNDCPIGKNYRTADAALNAAEAWLRANPNQLSLSRYGFDWQAEQRRVIDNPRQWGSQYVFETRIVEASRTFVRNGNAITATADVEVQWVRSWKEKLAVEHDGKQFTREEERREVVVSWYLATRETKAAFLDKPAVRSPRWSYTIYAEAQELIIEASEVGATVAAVDPHV